MLLLLLMAIIYRVPLDLCGLRVSLTLHESVGVDRWPEKQIHSHNYHVPEPYRNKVSLFCKVSDLLKYV
nr:flavin-containing monooxygenase FMO GS-OX-like 4 [Tanacetum cinerariifolium]